MSYQQLTPGQKEQIYKMSNDGKSKEEIVDFFKRTYQVKLEPWKISYIKRQVEKNLRGGTRMGGGVATRALKKREAKRLAKLAKKAAASAAPEPDNDDVDIQELTSLLQQIDAAYKKLMAHYKGIFKQLRADLIKSRAEVFEVLRGAGLEVPEEEK